MAGLTIYISGYEPTSPVHPVLGWNSQKIWGVSIRERGGVMQRVCHHSQRPKPAYLFGKSRRKGR
jgi:hypothetical protein